MHWEAQFRDLAASQQGLIARHQIPPPCTIAHWWQARRNARWECLTSRLLRMHGTPRSEAQRALAAVLDVGPDAALHGPSALAWYGMRGFDLSELHVACPRASKSRRTELARLHQLRDLRPHDIRIVRGVPTETALRAIWSESTRYSPPRLHELGVRRIGRLLDDAHVRGLVTWAGLHELVTDIHERGRAGSTIMRELARTRHPGTSPTESRNEDRLEELLQLAGQRPLHRQVVVGGREAIGRSDFRDDRLALVVEVNSIRYHSSPSDRSADQQRYGRYQEAGFTVVVVWEDDIWSAPSSTVGVVVEGRRRAAAGDAVVLHSPSCPWPQDAEHPVTVHRCLPALPYRG